MSHRRTLGATLLGISLLFAATSAQAQIKIGLTISASGPGAALGQPQMKSVQLLPKTIAGQSVTYVAYDDESDGTKAALNARKLLTEDKVDILIGSTITPSSMPLVDIASESKTPLITMTATLQMVFPMDEKRKWVYKVVPNDSIMASAMLKHIAKMGIKKLGFIGFADAYGEGYYSVIEKLAPSHGITVTTKEVFARTDTSVTGQVLKLITTQPDAIFIAAAGAPAVMPHKALRERGFKGTIFQTHGIATPDFIKLGGKDVEGTIFAGEAFTIVDDLVDNDPFKKTPSAYINAYKAAHGAPPTIFGAHTFDAVALIEPAVEAALKAAKPGTPEFRVAVRDEIEKTKNRYLNNGLANMTPEDHSGYDERSAFIIKIEGGTFRWVK